MTDTLSGLCIPETFAVLHLPGADILSTVATLVTDFTAESPGLFRMTQPSTTLTDASFCNVTISYTHPGQKDEIFVETWLPISSSPPSSASAGNDTASWSRATTGPGANAGATLGGTWNGRLQAVGGGGLVAGRRPLSYISMYGALADGYATVTTDAGLPHGMHDGDPANSWALLSPGNVDLYKLQNLASVSLDDAVSLAPFLSPLITAMQLKITV